MSTPAVEARASNADAADSYMNLAIRTNTLQTEANSGHAATAPVATSRRGRNNAARVALAMEEQAEERPPAEHSSVGASNVVDNAALDANLALVIGAGEGAVGGLNLQRPNTPLSRIKLSELSTSSSDSEGDNAQLSVNEAEIDANGDPRRAVSPPPNCAICLGRCKNKCFTDSCMHQFCFKCLCEWSKVKPECPLCKQTFKSIIHNVKSIDQFEEYLVQPPTVQIPHRPIEVTYRGLPHIFDGVMLESPNWETTRRSSAHRIRPNPGIYYSSLLSGDNTNNVGGNGVRNQFLHRSELLDMYRQEAPDAIVSSGTLSQLWRRFIYDRRLYALPVCDITGRFRECSARYYRDNPAQVHRLMPWINRDIVCLLRNTEHDVSELLERINENLLQTNIISPAFRRRLQPYLGSKTSHFIHELHNFARSPYDMIGYDRAVHYLPQAPEEIVIEFSSSASSEEDNANATEDGSERVRERERERGTNRAARNTGGYRVQSRSGTSAAAQQPMVNLLSFTISTTSEGTEAPGVTVAASGRGAQSAAINLTTHNRASDDIIDLDDSEVVFEAGTSNAATASTSATASTAESTNAAITQSAPVTVTENIELTSSSSDECEFVLERKPPHLRTPELVSLHSESDSDVVFVEETKPLHNTTYSSTSEDEHASQKSAQAHSASATATIATHATRAAQGNATQELYNVGASTSTGLRSSGGGRVIKQIYEKPSRSSLRQSRRKRSLRSAKDDANAVSNGERRYKDSSSNSSSSTSSTSESEDEEYELKRRRTRSKRNSSKKRPTLPRRATQKETNSNSKTNESSTNGRKRGCSKNKKQKPEVKKCKYEEKEDTSADNSSDDSQNLIELRKRLIALKDEGRAHMNDESSHNNSIFTEMQQPKCEPLAAEDSDHSACFPEATADSPARSDPIDIMTNFDNADSMEHNENSLQSDYSHQVSEAADEADGIQCFRSASANANEEPMLHDAIVEEENTFSSVTQSTTATNTTSTNRNERSHSRASVRSFGTTNSNDNSSASTRSTRSSTTSMSSPSMYTASSGGEGEDDSNDAPNAAPHDLRLQQLLDVASLEESWLVDDMHNRVVAHEGEEEENCEASDEANRQLTAITPPPRVVDAVALPDIESDVNGLFLSHNANLVMPFNYEAEGSQSDTDHNDDLLYKLQR